MLDEGWQQILESSADVAQLRRRLIRILADFGFTSFAYVPIDPPHGMKLRWITPFQKRPHSSVPEFISTFPEDWIAHYLAHDYSNIDPTFSHAAVTLFPFRWDLLQDRSWFTKAHRQFFSEAADFGVSSGLTIPLHGPMSGLATLNLASDLSYNQVSPIWEEHQLQLMRIAMVAHEMMLRFLSTDPGAAAEVKLTPRERECLLWISRGKTNWEVGEILDISHETVRFHLKNVMSKMGVYSQTHAAITAVARSLIFP